MQWRIKGVYYAAYTTHISIDFLRWFLNTTPREPFVYICIPMPFCYTTIMCDFQSHFTTSKDEEMHSENTLNSNNLSDWLLMGMKWMTKMNEFLLIWTFWSVQSGRDFCDFCEKKRVHRQRSERKMLKWITRGDGEPFYL